MSAPDAVTLLPCPFCGDPASLEQVKGMVPGDDVRWSIGCAIGCSSEECIGAQSLVTYARKKDAIAAWNRRAPAHPDTHALVPREPTEASQESENG